MGGDLFPSCFSKLSQGFSLQTIKGTLRNSSLFLKVSHPGNLSHGGPTILSLQSTLDPLTTMTTALVSPPLCLGFRPLHRKQKSPHRVPPKPSHALPWTPPWHWHSAKAVTVEEELQGSSSKEAKIGASLVVQWLRRRVPKAGDQALISGQGTRSHMHASTKDSACHNQDPAQPD